MYYSFSCHTFNDYQIPFSLEEYSKFKHGSKAIARKFGKELGKKLAESLALREVIDSLKDPIVISAPYKYIPVASTHLKDYFFSAFNLYHRGRKPLTDLKVNRGHSYHVDYGKMSKEEREKAINSDDFYIDANFISGRDIIVIDDVKITGAHERRIKSLLESVGFEGNVVFAYYADYTGDNPEIENVLNYKFVKDLYSINTIIREGEFLFNTRVVKFIMASSIEEFKVFILHQSHTFCETLLTCCLGNDYHRQQEFSTNFDFLNDLVSRTV